MPNKVEADDVIASQVLVNSTVSQDRRLGNFLGFKQIVSAVA